MHSLRSAAGFFRRPLLVCVLLAVLLLLAVKPVTFTFTHLHAFNCGSATISSISPSDQPSKIKQVANCFFQAHQRCSPATLRSVYLGTDTGSDGLYFTANSLGGCAITLQGGGSCHSLILPCWIDRSLQWVHRSFFPDETCQGLSLKPTELDLQDCGDAIYDGPMIRWDRIPEW